MIKTVSIEFEYNLPDEYLMQTCELGLVGTYTYTGPDKMYVFVRRDTMLLDPSVGHVPVDNKDPDHAEKEATLKAGLGWHAIYVDAAAQPVIATLIACPKMASELPQKEYKLDGDDTVYYSRPEPIMPDHCYETGEISYNLGTNSWGIFPWKQPHITMEEWDTARTMLINNIVLDIDDEDTSDELKTSLEAFKTALEALPTKFAGWSPWQIPFPQDPRSATDPEPEE
jgi:hypothetical protein